MLQGIHDDIVSHIYSMTLMVMTPLNITLTLIDFQYSRPRLSRTGRDFWNKFEITEVRDIRGSRIRANNFDVKCLVKYYVCYTMILNLQRVLKLTEQIKQVFGLFECKNISSLCHLPISVKNQILQM